MRTRTPLPVSFLVLVRIDERASWRRKAQDTTKDGEYPMNNDKLFVAYAMALIALTTSLLTASVMAGVTTAPSPLMFLEHYALGLLFRASYKWIAGTGNIDWPWQTDAVAEAAPAAPAVAGIDALEAQEEYADAA